MKKLATAAAIAALLGVSASASAWWGPGWGGPGYGSGMNDWWNDMMGDGYGDFNMSMSGGGRGWGRGYNRWNDYYGYGPYGWGGPYGGAPYYGGGYPYAYPYAAPAAPAANVTDGVLPAGNAARNYTVIQVNSAGTTRLQTAAEVQATGLPNTAGDYFHRRVPWNSTASSGNWDAPNGVVDQTDGISFNSQMNTWCSTCHTRYNAPSGAWETPSGDAIFKYRHPTTSNKPCTTCHVAHGSDAAMNGVYSGAAPYPGGTPVASSNRLLKIDNRGTCQACHDPTETITAGTGVGPVPVPLVP
jgi:hypothetical protein